LRRQASSLSLSNPVTITWRWPSAFLKTTQNPRGPRFLQDSACQAIEFPHILPIGFGCLAKLSSAGSSETYFIRRLSVYPFAGFSRFLPGVAVKSQRSYRSLCRVRVVSTFLRNTYQRIEQLEGVERIEKYEIIVYSMDSGILLKRKAMQRSEGSSPPLSARNI